MPAALRIMPSGRVCARGRGEKKNQVPVKGEEMRLWRHSAGLLRAGVGILAVSLVVVAAGATWAAPVPEKDESRILPDNGGKNTDSILPHAPAPEPGQQDGLRGGMTGGQPELPPDYVYEDDPDSGKTLEEVISEDIPDLKAVELTEEAAKRALDAFESVFGKFSDEEIAKYPTLQEFADKSPEGRKFAAIIRRHGFASVAEWNDIISNIGFAYTSIQEGHDDEIFRQIRETEKRTDLPKERKEKLLRYLRALIPSVNNRKVVQKLMKDPVYGKKLELLEGGGGGE